MSTIRFKNLSLIDLVNYKIQLMELMSTITDLNIDDDILNKEHVLNLAVIYSLFDKDFLLENVITLIDNEIDNKIDSLPREEISFYKSYFMLELEKISQNDKIHKEDFYRKRNAQYTYLDLDLRLSLHKIKLKTLMK